MTGDSPCIETTAGEKNVHPPIYSERGGCAAYHKALS